MHEIKVYVRFSETDAAGHVNNQLFFIYGRSTDKIFQ